MVCLLLSKGLLWKSAWGWRTQLLIGLRSIRNLASGVFVREFQRSTVRFTIGGQIGHSFADRGNAMWSQLP